MSQPRSLLCSSNQSYWRSDPSASEWLGHLWCTQRWRPSTYITRLQLRFATHTSSWDRPPRWPTSNTREIPPCVVSVHVVNSPDLVSLTPVTVITTPRNCRVSAVRVTSSSRHPSSWCMRVVPCPRRRSAVPTSYLRFKGSCVIPALISEQLQISSFCAHSRNVRRRREQCRWRHNALCLGVWSRCYLM